MAEVSQSEVKIPPELMVEYQRLYTGIWKWWEGMHQPEVDPVIHTKATVIALTQFIAVLAVDVGMTSEQFLKVCEAQWIAAYSKAPKFGE